MIKHSLMGTILGCERFGYRLRGWLKNCVEFLKRFFAFLCQFFNKNIAISPSVKIM